MTQVIVDEAGDEVVAVVIARLHAQRQRMSGRLGRSLQHLRLELAFEKIVTIALIDQDRQLLLGLGDQHAGIPLTPARTLLAEVQRERLLPHGQFIGLLIGEKADTD